MCAHLSAFPFTYWLQAPGYNHSHVLILPAADRKTTMYSTRPTLVTQIERPLARHCLHLRRCRGRLGRDIYTRTRRTGGTCAATAFFGGRRTAVCRFLLLASFFDLISHVVLFASLNCFFCWCAGTSDPTRWRISILRRSCCGGCVVDKPLCVLEQSYKVFRTRYASLLQSQ
jgi:hypothetical protein